MVSMSNSTGTFKLCKYGCGTYIEWSESLHTYVNAQTTVKHECPSFSHKGRAEAPDQSVPKPVIQQRTELDILLSLEKILQSINAKLSPVRDHYELG